MSYPAIDLTSFVKLPTIKHLLISNNLVIDENACSLTAEQLQQLLTAYCEHILIRNRQNLVTHIIPSQSRILDIKKINEKLAHHVRRVRTSLPTTLYAATSYTVHTKQSYTEQCHDLLSQFLAALLQMIHALKAENYSLSLTIYFALKAFVEQQTSTTIKKLSVSTKMNPFSSKQQSTTATLAKEALSLTSFIVDPFNHEMSTETTSVSDAFYSLWLLTQQRFSTTVIAENILSSYLDKNLLLKHFTLDTVELMHKNFVAKKYRTAGNLIIDYDNHFLSENKCFNASVVGCHGVSGCQKKYLQRAPGAWETITKNIRKEQTNTLISLGDTVYEHGATSLQRFDVELKAYHKKNSWVCFGNHEYSLCSGGSTTPATTVQTLSNLYDKPNKTLCGFQRGLLGWARSYLPEDKQCVKDQEIAVNDMSNIHVPYRYYAIAYKAAKTLMIVLDSNLFAFDIAQQKWFCETLQHSQFLDYKKVLVMHHPFIDPGKRGARTDTATLELVRYQKLISHWFMDIPKAELYDPRVPQMWIHYQQRSYGYDIKKYPTVGCFIAKFLVNNQLSGMLNKALVLSAHFHGYEQYEFELDEKAIIQQIIFGAGGAPLEVAKSLIKSPGSPNGIDLKDPDKWATFFMKNFTLKAHGGIHVYNYGQLNITPAEQTCQVELHGKITTKEALPPIFSSKADRKYPL